MPVPALLCGSHRMAAAIFGGPGSHQPLHQAKCRLLPLIPLIYEASLA